MDRDTLMSVNLTNGHIAKMENNLGYGWARNGLQTKMAHRGEPLLLREAPY